jgi:hypothetical protein
LATSSAALRRRPGRSPAPHRSRQCGLSQTRLCPSRRYPIMRSWRPRWRRSVRPRGRGAAGGSSAGAAEPAAEEQDVVPARHERGEEGEGGGAGGATAKRRAAPPRPAPPGGRRRDAGQPRGLSLSVSCAASSSGARLVALFRRPSRGWARSLLCSRWRHSLSFC